MVFGGEGAFELEGLGIVKDGGEGRSRGQAEGDEIATGEEGRGDEGLRGVGELDAFLLEEFVVVEEAVGAEAVDAVEFEFVVDEGAGEEAFEGGGAHLLDADEVHVIGDGGGGGFDDVVGVFEAAKDGVGHFGAEFVVAIEADAAGVGVGGLGGGFGDVVKEDGEDEGEGGVWRELGEHEAGVDKDIAFGVELRGLLAALEVEDFRKDLGHEAGMNEEVEAGLTMRGKPDAVEFVADAFGADFGNQGSGLLEGGPGGGFDGEAEGGGEADGAEEAEVVFLEAGGGFADGADELGFQVGLAVDVVDERTGFGVVEEAVDGEVTAFGVLFGCGKRNGFGAAAIAV